MIPDWREHLERERAARGLVAPVQTDRRIPPKKVRTVACSTCGNDMLTRGGKAPPRCMSCRGLTRYKNRR